jgi:hypothetical protein
MTSPVIQSEDALTVVTTGNLTPSLGVSQDNICIITMAAWVVNTLTGANVVAAPNGWTKLDSTTVVTASLIDMEIAVFWRRQQTGDGNPTFVRPSGWDTGTDTCWACRPSYISKCVTVGDPWDEFDPTAAYSTANQAFDAVTVSGPERLVAQFLVSTDNQSFGSTPAGWTAGSASTTATGTDAGFQTFFKDNQSSSSSADATTVAAPVQGRYLFYGFSFIPKPVSPPFRSSAQRQYPDLLRR